MKVHNRHGTPVDPVPFLVVSLLGFTVSYSYGPGYLLSFGFGIAEALVVSTAVFLAITAASYHRYVWTARPDLRDEFPPDVRFRRLYYAVLIGLGLLALLALPLLVR